MPALQIKDCPQDIYDRLKAYAAEEDRSMSQQTLHILKRFLNAHSAENHGSFWNARKDELKEHERIEKRRQLLESLSELKPLPLPDGYGSVAEMIREDRDGRTPELMLKETLR